MIKLLQQKDLYCRLPAGRQGLPAGMEGKLGKHTQGVATIPMVLALTVLMIAVVLAISTVAFNEAFIAQDFSRSSQALVYAEAGVRDGLIKVTRNGRYTSAGYNIDFVTNGCATNDGCATITVTSATSPKTIVSTGRVRNNIRKVQVTVTLDANWVITGTAWEEVVN